MSILFAFIKASWAGLGWAGLQILHFVDNDLIWEIYIYFKSSVELPKCFTR